MKETLRRVALGTVVLVTTGGCCLTSLMGGAISGLHAMGDLGLAEFEDPAVRIDPLEVTQSKLLDGAPAADFMETLSECERAVMPWTIAGAWVRWGLARPDTYFDLQRSRDNFLGGQWISAWDRVWVADSHRSMLPIVLHCDVSGASVAAALREGREIP